MSKIRRELEALKAERDGLLGEQELYEATIEELTAERDEAEESNRMLLSKLMLMEEQAQEFGDSLVAYDLMAMDGELDATDPAAGDGMPDDDEGYGDV